MDINLNTTIGELLKAHPAALEVLERFHLDCLGCKGSRAETLRLGALSHGVDPEELLRELQEFIKKRQARSGRGS